MTKMISLIIGFGLGVYVEQTYKLPLVSTIIKQFKDFEEKNRK
jgi:hypothetical protein